LLIKLIPGVSRDAALQGLQQAAIDLQNTYALRDRRYEAYCEWANNAVRQLRHVIRTDDLEALVLTQRYWVLQSLAALAGTPVVNDLLDMEVEERKRVIEDTVTELREQVRHWSRSGTFVVPDTSVFIKHPQKFRDWDLSAELKTAELDIHVLVPIIVVDELDRLKDSRDKHVRWRAAHTLGVLDEALGTAATSGQLVAGDPFARRGNVTVEVVLDPPRHVRLPIPDDEIIDRALAIQAIASHTVTLLTFDTGQSTRARQAGLPVRKLNMPDEPEPPAKC